MATWPLSLPQAFEGDGSYQEIPEDTVLRTTMDVGIVKLRRRQTRSVSQVAGKVIMTGPQVSTFMTFFNDTTRGGSISFNGLRGRIGLNQNYQFVESPTINHLGADIYEVTMKLLVLPT